MRLNQVKERMAGLEIKVWELDHSIKENFESKKKKKTYRITHRIKINNRNRKRRDPGQNYRKYFPKNLKKKSSLI